MTAAPSILFDSVVPLVSEDGAEMLAKDAASRDFVADAFAHLKFIGFTAAAGPLLTAGGVRPTPMKGLSNSPPVHSCSRSSKPAASCVSGQGIARRAVTVRSGAKSDRRNIRALRLSDNRSLSLQ
ncbi:MAG: hypothetical protein EOS27_18910 [Mesorhizobium sp.]|nr:MAG: hypothetical protein EOS27_18910 [Mesorhizobium sp.]